MGEEKDGCCDGTTDLDALELDEAEANFEVEETNAKETK